MDIAASLNATITPTSYLPVLHTNRYSIILDIINRMFRLFSDERNLLNEPSLPVISDFKKGTNVITQPQISTL